MPATVAPPACPLPQPNPAAEWVTLRIGGSFDWGRVQVFSANGQLVLSQELAADAGEVTLDVSNLRAGIYSVLLNLDGVRWMRRVVVE